MRVGDRHPQQLMTANEVVATFLKFWNVGEWETPSIAADELIRRLGLMGYSVVWEPPAEIRDVHE